MALDLDDISFADDSTGTALIKRSKGDQEGQGSMRYIASDTVELLRSWIEAAGITEGAIFRSITKGGAVRSRLSAGMVSRIIKKMASKAGVDADALSGHSARVGAAQDMVAAGLGVAETMQAGGWRSPTMVARYTEQLQARQGAMARLSAIQGR